MASILLFGAAGGLGQNILSLMPECQAFTHQNGDIGNFENIQKIIEKNRPQVIINAAAFTAVDLAESQKESAFSVNCDAVKNLAHCAKTFGSLLVHFSTDYVFDGKKSAPYSENDLPNPQNIYGQSKLKGEKAIFQSGCDFLILRTSWVFGASGSNFVKSIVKLAQENTQLKIVHDQIGCPTSTYFLAQMTQRAIAQTLENKQKCGLYHLTQSRALSWFEFAQEIIKNAKTLKIPLKVKEIQPIASRDFPRPAKRPKNSVLNCAKFAQKFGVHIPPFDADLKKMLSASQNPR